MKAKLIELLETFGYPVSLQGSHSEDETVPEHEFTFWQFETNHTYYGNKIVLEEQVYRVFFYSTNPELANSIFKKVRPLLMKNGFHCSGDYDIESDEDNVDAREMEVRIKIKYKEEEN